MADAAQRWVRDGGDWPHRERSRFVDAAGLRWHVQHWPAWAPGGAPTVVLLHGTGAATHSWRTLAPLMLPQANVIAMDLPGHGFTHTPPAPQRADMFTLPGMAAAVGGLLQSLGCGPVLLVGHSAGAAIALQMVLDERVQASAVVGLNAALLPMGGLLWPLVSSSARLIAGSGWVAAALARQARHPALVQRLLDGTGSHLDARGIALYTTLMREPAHVGGALAMMANWNLQPLLARLHGLRLPVQLVVAEGDRTVPPWQARHIWQHLPREMRRPLVSLPGLGHLAHEEDPAAVARVLAEVLDATGPQGRT